MHDHFDYEQAEFLKIPNFEEWAQDHIAKHKAFTEQLKALSVPLYCDFVNFVENWFAQHVMNTDFAYRGKMVQHIPTPYIWDESIMTFSTRGLITSIRWSNWHLVKIFFTLFPHQVPFDCIRECADDPSNAEKYAFCKTKLRKHFDYKDMEFCKVEGYDCYGHYLKHYIFQTKFQSAHLPLPKETTDTAKNWLAQHIKNNDFAYRGKLHRRRHYIALYLNGTSGTRASPSATKILTHRPV